jgi:mevalonate kinase
VAKTGRNQKVITSSPGKLILFGEHAVVYGKPCIVTAVDQRVHVTAQLNGVNQLVVNAPQMGIKNYRRRLKDLGSQEMPKQVSFIEAVVKRFAQKYGLSRGLDIQTKSDFSHTFGFGSSSAVTVASVKALAELYQAPLTEKELFSLSYRAVLDIQGVGSGFDLAAALWGKTIYFVTGAKKVSPVSVRRLPIIVAYSGVKADTPTLVRQVAELKRRRPYLVGKIFGRIAQIVEKGKVALETQRWSEVGKLMLQNQTLLEKLEVSSLRLEKLVQAAVKAGAYGAKLSGAGGGDCMIAVCHPARQRQVAAALTQAGGTIMKVRLNAQGVLCQRG